MIPMTCPGCGRRGNAPSDHINIRMHCPKCDAVFHLDKLGKVRIGEPHRETQAHERDHSYDEPYATSVTQLVLKSPWPVKLVLIGIVAAIGWKFFGSNLKLGPKPKELPELGYEVAYAFGDRQPDALKKLAAKGSEDAVQQWYDQLRPLFRFDGPHGSDPANYLHVDSSQTFVEPGGLVGKMFVNIGNQLDKPSPEALIEQKKPKVEQKKPDVAGYKWHGNFTLPTAWVKEKGKWKMDGPATLALSKSAETSPGKR